ncbi:MAG: putative molibdopterin-dependent oxidoreductase YjgC [Cellvibrionaceae bacterium]
MDFIKNYCDNFSAFQQDIETTHWHDIEAACSLKREAIVEAAELYSQSKNTVFAWGMGMTHHRFGCENVVYIANLALLRGMVGHRYRDLLPLRGHSNVQGIGSIDVKPVLADSVFEKIEKQLKVSLPKSEGLDTFHCLEAAHENNIDCACIVGGNLYSATPDSEWRKLPSTILILNFS